MSRRPSAAALLLLRVTSAIPGRKKLLACAVSIVFSVAAPGLFASKRVATPAEILTTFGIALTPEAVTAALRHTDGLVRTNAAKLLGERGVSKAIADLKTGLDDEYVYARIAAAGALLRLSDRSGVTVLAKELSSPDVVTVTMAANELVAAGDDRALEPLLLRLKSSDVPGDRLLLVRAIAQHGSFTRHRPRIEKVLIDRLLHDDGTLVRMASAEELASYPSKASRKALRAAAASDSEEFVRGVAGEALKRGAERRRHR